MPYAAPAGRFCRYNRQMLSVLLGALLVFSLRVCDVSLGTVRTLFTVRGRRYAAAGIALVESMIYLVAVASVLRGEMTWPNMIGYAAGFAAGLIVGVAVEEWIASGHVVIRVISRERPFDLVETLRNDGFGVTVVRGEGRDGEVPILFVMASRTRGRAALRMVRDADPRAFVTVDPIHKAIGGHLPGAAATGGMRKFAAIRPSIAGATVMPDDPISFPATPGRRAA